MPVKVIPPWHQSTEILTSCPHFYIESEINNNRLPGGMDSARGLQVHRTMASYTSHCALKGVSVDLAAFDQFAAGAGPVAARILAGVRDGFEVDYRHILATELTLSLDEDFTPTDIPEAIAGMGAQDSENDAAVVGTLDALYSFPEQGAMRIDDYKSHPRPFDPADKLQCKTYSLMIFAHFPWVMRVTFRLIFVRYRNVVREVEFTRSDVPDLLAAVKSARARQVSIHADYEAGKAIDAVAGNHCCYCPLLSNAKCPIAKYNPQMQLTPEQRLNFNLWYSQFSRQNNAAMRTYVQETGKRITLKDFNGKSYIFGEQEKEAELFPVFQMDGETIAFTQITHQPVLPIIDLLADYAADNPDDSRWMRNVVISSSSLRKYLKANKRSFLDQAIEDTCEKVTKVSLRVSKPLDAVPDEEDEDEDEEDFEDE